MIDEKGPKDTSPLPDSLAETIARDLAPYAGELPAPGATLSPRGRDVAATLAVAATQGAESDADTTRTHYPRGAPGRPLPTVVLAGEGDPDVHADFAVEGLLGEGGMGRVDLAVQLVFGRNVALKRVRPDRRCAPAFEALSHEAAVSGTLDHPNIVPAYAFGQTPSGDPVLVLKRVEGVPWSTLIHNDSHPAWEGRADDRLGFHLEVMRQVCNAIESAHRRGVLHRDIKPDNVMVGSLGEVYVLDWGIAVLLSEERSSELAGTASYMAPEMLLGSATVTPRTDVYLLGATLHEVLTRTHRHAGANIWEVLHQVYESKPVVYDATIPRELSAICQRATGKDPEARFPSALAMREAIDVFLHHRGSLELCAEGERRLGELHEALAACEALGKVDEVDGGDIELASARVRKVAAEADFAFRQALKGWPDSEEAAAGRRRTLERMAEFELSQHNAPGARALLAELDLSRTDLADRLAKLELERAAEAEARRRLAHLRYQASLATSAPQRAIILGAMYGLLGATSLALGLLGFTLTPFGLLVVFAVALVAMLALLALRGRTLLATQANRRLQATVMVGLVTGVAVSVTGWRTGVSTDVVLAVYYVLFVFSTFMLAIWSERAALLFIPIAIPPIAMSLLWPGHGYYALAATCAVGIPVALARALWRREVAPLPSRTAPEP